MSTRSTLTALETVALLSGNTRVAVAPARGGMVTRFDVDDRPVLFLDEASLVDPSKNVRGGNPVLFPSPGPLTDERFARDGVSGTMKQHGFARQQAWSVVAQSADEVTLELASNDVTRAQYPWDFAARLRYAVMGTKLVVETRVQNRSAAAMPFALGFHPYFRVRDDDKARARIVTDATRGFDNVTKTMVDVKSPIDLTVPEVDLHLANHRPPSATLSRSYSDSSGSDRIVVGGDGAFGRWVVWTVRGKDFVCLEPWTAAANALNTGEGLLHLASGEVSTFSMSITLESA